MIAWLFDEEQTHDPQMSQALAAMSVDRAIVPAIWSVEVTNGLRAGERRGRATPAEIRMLIEQIRALDIEVDPSALMVAFDALLDLARRYDLTVYDGSTSSSRCAQGSRPRRWIRRSNALRAGLAWRSSTSRR